MNNPTNKSDSQYDPVFTRNDLIIIRLGIPDSYLKLASNPYPVGNQVGVRLFGLGLCHCLGFYKDDVTAWGALNTVHACIICSRLTVAEALPHCLNYLQQCGLSAFAVIASYDSREEYFREYHRGDRVEGVEMITPKSLKQSSEEYVTNCHTNCVALTRLTKRTEIKIKMLERIIRLLRPLLAKNQ